MSGKVLFVLMGVFLVNSHSINHLRHSCPFLCKIQVSWFEGKDAKTKAAVAAEITESIVKNTGTDPSYIYIVFEDIKPSDWACAGKCFE